MRNLMPLYTWSQDLPTYARRVAELHPGDVAIVVSDNSGPGTIADPALMQHVADLVAKGVIVAGYIHIDEPGRTRTRTIDAVLDDIEAWHRLYGVTRLFMDEWPMHWGMRHLGAVWGATRGYAGKGTTDRPILVVNPGQPLGIVKPPDGVLVVTYEGTPTASTRRPQPWEAILVHDCPTPALELNALAALGWQWGWVTSDGADGNAYDGIGT